MILLLEPRGRGKSVIVSEVYDALLSAGAPEAQARAAAAAIPLQDNVATKEDLSELKAELKTEIAVLKFAIFTFFPIVLGLLVKIAFFPG